MITESERKLLKKLLKGHYTKDVLNVLNQKGIKNSKNQPYTSVVIRQVLAGGLNIKEVEDAIFEVYNNRKLQQQEDRKRKINILGQ